jgi:hypothetical protein
LLVRVHWRRDSVVSRRMGYRSAVRILLWRVRCDLYVAAFAHRSKERYLILIEGTLIRSSHRRPQSKRRRTNMTQT